MLSSDDVRKVAELARLELTEEQFGDFTDQLGKIVAFVEQLNELGTEGIEPMAHPLDVFSVVRRDVVEPGLGREDALRNAPKHDNECFLVPPVLGP